jgi:hypothetical protein
MKTFVSLGLAVLTLTSAQAQVFRPRAVIGALPGRIAGDHSGDVRHRDWRGAGGGYFYRHQPVYSGYRSYGGFYRGWGDGYYGYVDFAPASGYYGYVSGAANGLWLGALAGGIIGHNSGSFRHDAWRGAAWGAGLGWLLGSMADANRPAVAYQTPMSATAPAPAPSPQQVTIINNYYGASATPMTAANSLFGR